MSSFDQLIELAAKRCPNDEYEDRLRFEEQEIHKLGLEQYWIDTVKECYKSGVKYKTNKNGLVFPFLLGITKVNPIKEKIAHNVKKDYDMPDIDLDFISEARDIVREFAIQKYGNDKVCGVGNWNTYNPKSALQDVAKALGRDDKKKELMIITKGLPDEFDDLEFREAYSDDFPTFKNWVDRDDINREIAQNAFRLVGKIKSHGQHAGGLIISRIPLNECLPMTYRNGRWISEWTEGSNVQLSKFGFVKYDVLGLKTMNYIWKAERLVEERHGIKLDWDEIGYEDEEALKLADEVKTASVFQLDTGVAKGILSRGGVKSFADIMVYTSLGRPGPMPMIKDYIERRDNLKPGWEEEEHPEVLKLMKNTYGVCTYQEQVTAMLTTFGGFSIPEADKARKIMSKKWADQMVWVKEKILTGFSKTLPGTCPKSKLPWSEEYWNRLETFARYSFNQAHATSYTIAVYKCLYLKAHYNLEWWCAVLNGCDIDKRVELIGSAKSEGVRFKVVDYKKLSKSFAVVDDYIVMGLNGIKGIGKKMIENLDVTLEYSSFDDMVEKIGKNKTLFERLIKLGAFDELYENRQLLWYWYQYKYGTCKEATAIRKVISEVTAMIEEEIMAERELMAQEYFKKYPKRKAVPSKISKWKPKKKKLTHDEFMRLSINDYEYDDILAYQKEYLGFHWDSPLELYIYDRSKNISNAQVTGELHCVVVNAEHRKTKKGDRFVSLHVTDGMDNAKIQIWDDELSTIPDEYLEPGFGMGLDVVWKEDFKSFNLNSCKITRLHKKSDPIEKGNTEIDITEYDKKNDEDFMKDYVE